jgi:hypothetical protein
MSAPSRWTIRICTECGERLGDHALYCVVEGHELAEEVEVIPLADAQKVEAERDEARNALKEAIHAGETLALHTHGRSENRGVAEAKEQLDRARAASEDAEGAQR